MLDVIRRNELYVSREYEKCRRVIKGALARKNYEKGLAAAAVCSQLLYLWNQNFTDAFLEQAILEIAQKTLSLEMEEFRGCEAGPIVFYDNFGLDTRGLALIYIKALGASGKRVVYMTTGRARGRQPEIDKVIDAHQNIEREYFVGESHLAKLYELQGLVLKCRPSQMFWYTTPDDSSGIALAHQVMGRAARYQVNLTDHAFWLGSSAFDFCIEFRDYGAYISSRFRGIPLSKIIKLPYYPVVPTGIEFQGFPFEPQGRKILFSGGSLYKTVDENKTYYNIVDSILRSNPDLVFLYAGGGDMRHLEELRARNPGRVFHTEERRDLFQLMRHITLYLNTYPMVGGLMTQYAAIAEKIPLTLRRNQDASGILIGQGTRRIEYESAEELIEDACRLLKDGAYLRERERLLEGSVISEEMFCEQVDNIIKNRRTCFVVDGGKADVAAFLHDYKHRFDRRLFEDAVANKSNLSLVFEHFGWYARKVIVKIIRNLSIVGGGYDVSVLICTYNPDPCKLLMTISSALVQKKVRLQVVICDDGSVGFPYTAITDFFRMHGFEDYVVCLSEENQGTVRNVINGVAECKGEYVKTIGPGDFLYGEEALFGWLDFLRRSKADFSVCNAVYYSLAEDGALQALRCSRNPQATGSYFHGNWFYDYLIFDDIALGASILVKTSVLSEYLFLIKDEVIYAEDNVFRVMAADRRSMARYDFDALLYEYGTGISTSRNSFWQNKLADDWNAADRIILGRLGSGDSLKKQFAKVVATRSRGIKGQVYRSLFVRGWLLNKVRRKVRHVYTNTDIDGSYIRQLQRMSESVT